MEPEVKVEMPKKVKVMKTKNPKENVEVRLQPNTAATYQYKGIDIKKPHGKDEFTVKLRGKPQTFNTMQEARDYIDGPQSKRVAIPLSKMSIT